MEFLRPASWREALEAKAAYPDATPIAGGTDVMVELNFDRQRPEHLLDLTSVPELAEWAPDGDVLHIGPGVPYARIIEELGERVPGLAMASRTVGSPQIRNRGTVGGNLGSASPAGDAHPSLLAAGASVVAESVRGSRVIPVEEFFAGPKRNVLEPDELIAAIRIAPAAGPQQFSKVGTRNAMVIAVCTFAISLDPASRTVGTGIGSAAPTPVRAREAEDFLTAELDWDAALEDSAARRFGELVAQASSPIDDVRGSAQYRQHALGVLARRTLSWAWHEHRSGRQECA
ncbi:FAD binding domain-containing protein [Saccharopolyspora dendranthemae]|uniref:CO/xanthine dehydrogenase FAD-binding subunit n=1 Tax=Saccharopolyspora dendranthemae TaxID=1181886 RepID=A0A561U2D9_9PSEU|nr:FAD binding domain-containing protein [Saccharopolyspora dendranthemae]TWF93532.1 CO/xanthine dehydrogenase FAD-binding subunit [Saccharopolyspora dendranthemae]